MRLDFGAAPEDDRTFLRRYSHWLMRSALPGVTEWIPTYRTITVYYRPLEIGYEALCLLLVAWQDAGEEETPSRTLEIPVRYGGADGVDLPTVAARHGLSEQDVIALHSAPLYEVVMIGFLPGFPYLRGLPAALHTPRRDSPRLVVPAGSVGIGGTQTGVYPLPSPGGWHLIGRTECVLFDAARLRPSLLTAGDHLRFVPV